MESVCFGVVGNMGPEADELFQSIVRRQTGAKTDQENITMIVVKNPKIPDRTEAILSKKESPVPAIIASLKILEASGVQYAVMPCNTAHYFLEEVQKGTKIRILNMLEITATEIKRKKPNARIGLLATNGTIQTGIYDKYLKGLLKLSPKDQEDLVHSSIYGPLEKESKTTREKIGIKSGTKEFAMSKLREAVQKFKEMGADTIILGCTELPIVREFLQKEFPDITFIDPMEEVAKKVVLIYEESLRQVKESSIRDKGKVDAIVFSTIDSVLRSSDETEEKKMPEAVKSASCEVQ